MHDRLSPEAQQSAQQILACCGLDSGFGPSHNAPELGDVFSLAARRPPEQTVAVLTLTLG